MKTITMTEEEETVLNSALVQYMRREKDTEKIKIVLNLLDRVVSTEE